MSHILCRESDQGEGDGSQSMTVARPFGSRGKRPRGGIVARVLIQKRSTLAHIKF